MTAEEYALNLGKLWGRFQSLDILIRLFLHSLPNAASMNLPPGIGLFSLKVGDQVNESALSNRDYFSTLVKAYNKEVALTKIGQPISEDLIDLRNALAHGLVTADTPDGNFRIVHFEKVADGTFRIIRNDQMDQAWFEIQSRSIEIAFRAVQAAFQRVMPKTH